MSEIDSNTDSRPSRPLISLPRFQFSLAWLLIAVTVVAVVLGVATSFRDFLGALFLVIVCCVLPTPFVICAIYGRGNTQTFAIGALVPWVMLLPWMSTMAIWLIILPVVCGTIAVATRKWIQQFGGR